MKLFDLIREISYQQYGEISADTFVSAICFDSRKVTEGALFICIEGETSDGHDFALQAEKAGACAIVAQRKTASKLPHFIVENSRKAMFDLAAAFYGHPEKEMHFIGVTGTNGKTSTTFFIKQLLDVLGEKAGLMGTVCNMIGDRELPSGFTTPEPAALFSLLRQMKEEGVTYVVMEVSSHSLSQDRVCGIPFEVGVFTNLTQDHLDYHKTIENYKNEKKKLFLQSKTCVLNIDDPVGKEYLAACEDKKVLTYSAHHNEADYVAKEIKLRADGVKFMLLTRGSLQRIRLSTPGIFTVYNISAAVAALCAAGFPFEKIVAGVEHLPQVAGRAQMVEDTGEFGVMIDYAHTPDALENILKTVRGYAPARIITLFGCGGDRDSTKRPIMGAVAAEHSDYLVVTSDNPRTEDPSKIIADIMVGIKDTTTPYTVIENRREAIAFALSLAEKEDIVILAGKGHEKYQILSDGKIDFDEEQIVKECLQQMQQKA